MKKEERIIKFFDRNPYVLQRIIEGLPYMYDYGFENLSIYKGDKVFFDSFFFINKYIDQIVYHYKSNYNIEINPRFYGQDDEAQILNKRREYLLAINNEPKYNAIKNGLWRDESESIGPWSNDIIEMFITKWDWLALSENNYIIFDDEKISKFEKYINWNCLLRNKSLKSDRQRIIIKYIDKISFELLKSEDVLLAINHIEKLSFSQIFSLFLNKELYILDSFDYLLNYLFDKENTIPDLDLERVSYHISTENHISWSYQNIKKYSRYLNFKGLCDNSNVELSIEIIECFKNQIDWWIFFRNYNFQNSKANIEEIIYTYEEFVNWGIICENKTIDWNEEMLNKYFNKLNWFAISENPNMSWDFQMLLKFKDKLDWSNVSRYGSFEWTIDLINYFEIYIDFKMLSENKFVKWDLEMINRFKNKLDFKSLSSSSNMTWSIDILIEFESEVNWEEILINDKSIIWDKIHLERFAHNFDWKGRDVYLKGSDRNCYLLPKCISVIKLNITQEFCDYFKNIWTLSNKFETVEWDVISLKSIIPINVFERNYFLFDLNYILDNGSISSFQLLETMEKKLGAQKFKDFLLLNRNGYSFFLDNCNVVWLRILRFYFNEKVLRGFLKIN